MTLPHSVQRKHTLLVKTKKNSKSQNQIYKRKVPLELLYHILGHRSTRLILARDNANFWQEIDLRVDPDPLFPSSQISTINKNARSKTPLKANTPFKRLLVDIISATSSKTLTKYTTFYNNLLIVDAYSNITKLYIMENITTDEVMEKPDKFQAIFGKVD